MIQKIHNYFKSDRSYEGGLILVMQFTPKMALKKQLNVQPASSYLHGVIHEELRQLAGIGHKDFELLIAQPVLENPVSNEQAKAADPEDQAVNPPEQKKASRKK